MVELALRCLEAAAGALFLVAAVVAIEWISPLERVSWKQRVPGSIMVALGAGLGVLVALPLQYLWTWLGLKGLAVVPVSDWLAPLGMVGTMLNVLIVLLLYDFLGYWRHRAEHRWLWRIHLVHHAPTELHAANSIGHPLNSAIGFVTQTIPLSMIQFSGPGTPFAVSFAMGILLVYIHSPIDAHFGPLRRLLVDNRHHRIHHSLEPHHFDKNFGTIFSFWDRLFGTEHWPDPEEWPAVGVAGVPAPQTVEDFLMMPVRYGSVVGDPPAQSGARSAVIERPASGRG